MTIIHILLWPFPRGSQYLTYIFKPPLSKKLTTSSSVITPRSHWIQSSRWLTTLWVKPKLPLLPNPPICYMQHCTFCTFFYLEFSVPFCSPITAPLCHFLPTLPLLLWIPFYLHTQSPPWLLTTTALIANPHLLQNRSMQRDLTRCTGNRTWHWTTCSKSERDSLCVMWTPG